ncbi:growth/differentiation factor [Mycobacterium sp. CBMA293]|uniref:growth/differentiation factor n=1 Tax=unclassified Mycolicibacterium TaxID=2636767 RepID=UPI001325E497|nr:MULTISPECIES: growth/differentiation factor [unclassified Mycolicibacterium]MUL46629.1 growth/differentiation factor [Mycolicibacterium sp. CBMA 360]MUL94428.1 growth/differentiation factor [Mycolicibacterium sp. CBMA 230]MUM34642.1 growth/differentiation factor [Mycolicibacterium sp. CBMA 361]MUL59070.1 growth/differentiation factor [Mycolicibacterium sp. CBMA 335]MUL69464.1 growth/differentiation factor [Mycolicibacterium sp. CBMA 311]
MYALILSTAVDIVATSHHHTSHSSSSNSSFLREVFPFLFLLTGPAFFMYQYRRYRNQDKRHHHERETLSDIAHMRTVDQFARSVTNSRDSSMSGANEHEVRG